MYMYIYIYIYIVMMVMLKILHVKHLPADRSQCQRLIVRRKHIFEDALHRYRSGIDLKKYIKVTYVGEPAADEGDL